MKLVNGWYVPDIDECCLPAILSELPDLAKSYKFVKNFRTAIQAGGNVGVYPTTMALQFERVITVEPDPANYEALLLNVADIENIEHLQVAFGERAGKAAIDHIQPENIGAHQLKVGNDIKVIAIDSLDVHDCDFLQLDVEGSEHQAIMGAERTIKKSYPVITLELKGLGSRYAYSDEDTIKLLQSWGYEIVGRVNRDVIFARN
jgi:FkbM family methyltransferase